MTAVLPVPADGGPPPALLRLACSRSSPCGPAWPRGGPGHGGEELAGAATATGLLPARLEQEGRSGAALAVDVHGEGFLDPMAQISGAGTTHTPTFGETSCSFLAARLAGIASMSACLHRRLRLQNLPANLWRPRGQAGGRPAAKRRLPPGRRSASPMSSDAHSGPGPCRGRYQTDLRPGALHATVRCPRACRSGCAARAGAQWQRCHDTRTRPGPHSCPFSHRSG